ncbi:MAG: hypothetical protein IKE66_01030 [Hyphomicrobium sp.]|nr:hypothetical protein [Hyphomicrobium sp.]
MAALNAYEQLLLELMNRARLDPASEAARLGISLNAGLAAGTISTAAKAVLAPNSDLVTAARGHSQYMIDVDQFAHSGIGDGTPTSRMQAAGYTLTGSWRTGENMAWVGTTGTANAIAFTMNRRQPVFERRPSRQHVEPTVPRGRHRHRGGPIHRRRQDLQCGHGD